MHRKQQFTLVEIIVAIALTAILFAAVATVFQQVFKFRDRHALVSRQAFQYRRCELQIAADLQGIVCPGGVLSGELLGTTDEQGDNRKDTLELVCGRLPNTEDFGGELRHVTYQLAEPETTDVADAGYDLVRLNEPNLLATDDEDPESKVLLSGLAGLEFAYYDGVDWLESWELSTSDNQLPKAIRVTLTLRSEQPDAPGRKLELLIPVIVQPLPTEQGESGS